MSQGTHSISRHLSLQLAMVAVVGFGVLSTTIYYSVAQLIANKQTTNEASTRQIIEDIVQLSAAKGGEPEVILKTQFFAPRRPGSRLVLLRSDGSTLHRDADEPPFVLSEHVHRARFDIQTPNLSGGIVHADLLIDIADDVRILRGLVVTLIVATLVGGVLAYVITLWRVRAGVAPLREIVRQTRQISPKRLDQRLSLATPVEELTPWIDQFNDLMARLEGAYQQLEGFNADVAHELRTPLATLIGETEVALSRERSPETLRETLISNLEELQRLAAMVNDMLFLSNADRGARARRGVQMSLAALAHQVTDFHEAALAERNLQVVVTGDAVIPVDEPLLSALFRICSAMRSASPTRIRRSSCRSTQSRPIRSGFWCRTMVLRSSRRSCRGSSTGSSAATHRASMGLPIIMVSDCRSLPRSRGCIPARLWRTPAMT